MKKAIFQILITITLVFCCQQIFAQNAPAPPSNHGATTNQTGGGAPIGEGMYLLLAMGGIYGVYKMYQYKKAEKA